MQLQNPFVYLQQYYEACPDVTQDGYVPGGVSSIKISRNKSWEVFSDKYYRGDRMVLRPGDYATDQELMNTAVLSFRPVESQFQRD